MPWPLAKSKADDCRLLFCINPGRSGSEYLAKLLGTAGEVLSFHEAEPTMTGSFLYRVNSLGFRQTYQERLVKANAINEALSAMPKGKSVYADTSHMFVKTFADVIVGNFQNIEVLILRRDPSHVLRSFVRMGYFRFPPGQWPDWTNEWPDWMKVWPDWMSSPSAVTRAIEPIDIDSRMDHVDRCIAYLLDMEARTQRFQETYPWVKCHPMRVESLNDRAAVRGVFKQLRITFTDETDSLVGHATNQRPRAKAMQGLDIDEAHCRQRIADYCQRAEGMGIKIPKTFRLTEAERL